MHPDNEEKIFLKDAFQQGFIAGTLEHREDLKQRFRPTFRCRSPYFETIFGLTPQWIDVEYSNRNLTFFQGALFWSEGTRCGIQLRASFKSKSKLYGLYSKEELIAHEFVHALRMNFEESQFEEVLAYQTAKTSFRRFFGPLFQNKKESLLFMAFPLLLSILNLFPYFSFYYSIVYVISSAFFLFVSYLFGRLCWRQYIYKKCLRSLIKLLDNNQKARALALALTDKEIIQFSRFETHQILKFASLQKESSTRWRQIFFFFFPHE